MAAQYPGVAFRTADMLTLCRKFRALQHYRFAVNARHELGHAVSFFALIIGVVGVIAAPRLGRCAFKAAGNNYLRLACFNFCRRHCHSFQPAAALHVHAYRGYAFRQPCFQCRQARNVSARAHAVAANYLLRHNIIFFRYRFQHRCAQKFCRYVLIYAARQPNIAAQPAN